MEIEITSCKVGMRSYDVYSRVEKYPKRTSEFFGALQRLNEYRQENMRDMF